MIAILDYGVGNLGSIHNMLKYLDIASVVTDDVQVASRASKMILPGVGAFDFARLKLEETGLADCLREHVLIKKQLCLGICLGMQLLFEQSAEGQKEGFRFLSGQLERFDFHEVTKQHLKVPHVGWSYLKIPKDSLLFSSKEDGQKRFYFVHSYRVEQCDDEDVTSFSKYGDFFPASVEREHVLGVQFHPEKSHKYGLELFRKFADL